MIRLAAPINHRFHLPSFTRRLKGCAASFPAQTPFMKCRISRSGRQRLGASLSNADKHTDAELRRPQPTEVGQTARSCEISFVQSVFTTSAHNRH